MPSQLFSSPNKLNSVCNSVQLPSFPLCILNDPSYFVRRLYTYPSPRLIQFGTRTFPSDFLGEQKFGANSFPGGLDSKSGQFHEVKALIITCTYAFNLLLVNSSKLM